MWEGRGDGDRTNDPRNAWVSKEGAFIKGKWWWWWEVE